MCVGGWVGGGGVSDGRKCWIGNRKNSQRKRPLCEPPAQLMLWQSLAGTKGGRRRSGSPDLLPPPKELGANVALAQLIRWTCCNRPRIVPTLRPSPMDVSGTWPLATRNSQNSCDLARRIQMACGYRPNTLSEVLLPHWECAANVVLAHGNGSACGPRPMYLFTGRATALSFTCSRRPQWGDVCGCGGGGEADAPTVQPTPRQPPGAYTHQTQPTSQRSCRSRWAPYH